jgi:hypothetical protein
MLLLNWEGGFLFAGSDVDHSSVFFFSLFCFPPKFKEMEELIPIVKDKINSLIKKPNMSEKLLMKPPFRFLHDTISAVIQTTGFAEGLYSPEEMDSSTINEKGAKIAYLDKIFGVVGICNVCLSSYFCPLILL